MKRDAIFLFLAIIVVFFILLVGIFLAEKNLFSALLSLMVAIVVMGFGFRLKKKWNR